MSQVELPPGMMHLLHHPDGRIVTTIQGVIDDGFYARVAQQGLAASLVPIGLPAEALANAWVNGETGQIEPRPSLGASIDRVAITADGTDTAHITGLPVPCTVMIDGESHAVDDGEVEFAADKPGLYTISCSHWPYLPWSAEITAEEAW